MKKTSVLIVDSRHTFCAELADALNKSEKFEVLAITHDNGQANALFQKLTPDIMILDRNCFDDTAKEMLTSEERIATAVISDKLATQSTATNPEIDRITAVLHEIGVPAHIKGYQYLREALILAADNANRLSSMQKMIYPQVSEAFSTTPSRVQRAIQHAIEVAWSRDNSSILQRLFGEAKPTNCEFISRITEDIRPQPKC